MKTEFDFGYEFAEFESGDGPVNVEQMVHSSRDIPDEDYKAMVKAGIENPDARLYWEGYNSFFD